MGRNVSYALGIVVLSTFVLDRHVCYAPLRYAHLDRNANYASWDWFVPLDRYASYAHLDWWVGYAPLDRYVSYSFWTAKLATFLLNRFRLLCKLRPL